MHALYAEARAGGDGPQTWQRWRQGRDRLFATHPQSALPGEQRGRFEWLPFFPYDPDWRIEATVDLIPAAETDLVHSGAGTTRFVEFARVEVRGTLLSVYWLNEYGGGVFLPFRDATNGTETYGGGRYLLDTVKGADLGGAGRDLVLDFNYSYHPSCAYDPVWSCPLPPPGNRFEWRVEAGEQLRPV